MSVLLQISDTHFGTEQPPVVDALLHLVEATHPQVIVWSGDITQRARRGQFQAAQRFRQRLGTRPVITIPGNHDIPLFNLLARVLFPYANYIRAFGPALETNYDDDAFNVTAINTTRRHRHIDGEISAAQIDAVTQRLAAAPHDRIRIVVTHQPVHVIRAEDETNLVHGHAAAVRAWTAAGADVVMGGHIHLPYVRPLSQKFSGLRRRAWAVQAGTALSHRVRHGSPNSVNIVRRLSQQPLTYAVERWDYSAGQKAFAAVDTQQLLLDR
ncbi:metallophosphoesterase [Povalibacter sp.]|uniref:metallophosphoesterase family protein n=1 Tax=Povalibacter sp. TaxID=1962978 RepID=UPI002F3F49EC